MARAEVGRQVGQHHGDLRTALVEAALALVGAHDTSAVTLRAVARRAGVSPGAPYHHFPSRAALMAEIARLGFEQLDARQAGITTVEPTGRLRQLVESYVRFGSSHRAHYAVMFEAMPGADPHPTADAEPVRLMATAAFTRLVGAVGAVASTAHPDHELRRRAFLVWALAHGAVDASRWSEGVEPTLRLDAVAASVADAAVRLARG